MQLERNFRDNRLLQVMSAAYLVLWVFLAFEPLDRYSWFLENLLVFLFIAGLLVTYRKFKFTNLSYFLIIIFLVLHTIGAHYSYWVPIGEWFKSNYNFSRNHYDRLVHFSYGLLLTYPIYELIFKRVTSKMFWSLLFAVSIIMGTSAFYELIEMWVAQMVSPKLGIDFVGIQGDVWDAQKDMALALYGSLIAIVTIAIIPLIKKVKRDDNGN